MIFFITGISKGLGFELAKHYLKNGDKVFGISKSALPGDPIIAEAINNKNLIFNKIDINSLDDVRKAINSAICNFGKIDVLINNAAVKIFKEPEFISYNDFEKSMHTNFLSQIYITLLVIEEMKKIGAGTIINISSRAGMEFYDTGAVYCISKSSLINFTKIYSSYLKKYNIRIYVLSPPTFSTLSYRTEKPEVNHSKLLQSDDVISRIDKLVFSKNFLTGQNFPFFSIKSLIKYFLSSIFEFIKYLLFDVRRL